MKHNNAEIFTLPQFEPEPIFSDKEVNRYLELGKGYPRAYRILNQIIFSQQYTKEQILVLFDILSQEELTGASLVKILGHFSGNVHALFSNALENSEEFKAYLGLIRDQKTI